MGVVGRTVQRVDDPPKTRITAGARAALFSQDAVAWKSRQQRVADFLLALQVDFGDDVDDALVADVVDRIDPPTQNLAGRPGGLDTNLARAT